MIERAVELYRERFGTVSIYENHVYEGVPVMLDAAARCGDRLFVATSKPLWFAERIVRHFSLDRYFAGVYGPDLDGRLDDKADLLAHLLMKGGSLPRAARGFRGCGGELRKSR